MPEIARFYGIIIKLFFGDHPPPHFHAVYGEYVGVFDINTLEMFEGDLPGRAKAVLAPAGVQVIVEQRSIMTEYFARHFKTDAVRCCVCLGLRAVPIEIVASHDIHPTGSP